MEYWANVLDIVLIYCILGISLNLVLGYSGIMSLAHAIYFGVAAYIVALISIHGSLSSAPIALIAIAITGAFAAITAFPALRVRGEYVILLTLALQLIASDIMNSWVTVTNGPSGVPGVPPLIIFGHTFLEPSQLIAIIGPITIVVFLFSRRITRSAFGRALKSIRDNESAAVAAGKNVVLLKVIIFGVSGALAGLAGVLFAREQGFISPSSFDLNASILFVALVALGGAANLYGTVAGAVLIIGAPELLTFLNIGSTDAVSAARGVIFGLLLMLFARFRPQGIIPEPKSSISHYPKLIEPDPLTTSEITSQSGRPISRVGDHALEVRGLGKHFGGIVTADNVNVTLEFGKITALIGPNGAGKTTLFNLLAGVIKPERGHIYLHGVDITNLPAWRRTHKGLGRSFQDVRIFDRLTTIDNVLIALPHQPGESILRLFFTPLSTDKSERTNRRRALGYLRQVGLQDKALEPASSLSYGEQKLLAIARLVATGADILLFDEPAAGVDESWAERMLGLIRELARSGKAVCLVEHNLSVVRALADTVYFMVAGRIVAQGPVADIMGDPRLAEIYFGQSAVPA